MIIFLKEMAGIDSFPDESGNIMAYQDRGGGRGGSQQSLILGGSDSEVQPLALLYTIFNRKRYPFRIPSIDKWYPFHKLK